VYPDARVSQFVTERFVPVRVHVREQADEFQRLGQHFGANWTPTVLIVDASGQERHRIEGFLPADDFIAQLALGHAHAHFARGEFAEAARHFEAVLQRHAQSDAAPEARYWMGVSKYKETNDPAPLAETARDLQQRYAGSPWAKKASVWAPAEAG
jgi:TolA-binding protein